jgi:hypothetical protein
VCDVFVVVNLSVDSWFERSETNFNNRGCSSFNALVGYGMPGNRRDALLSLDFELEESNSRLHWM